MKTRSWLFPLSIIYQAVVQTRNRLYDLGILTTHNVGVPVISVGNLSVGGTGKTPFVIYLVERLRTLIEERYADCSHEKVKRGGNIPFPRPCIVTRGYKGNAKGTTVVSNGKRILVTAMTGGDEPVMMAESLPGVPVIVDRNRVRGADAGIKDFKAGMILLDDGFQHRQIVRDLDIVLLDGKDPLGNRMTLPAGFLREPVSTLSRADIVVLSKATGSDDELAERGRKLESIIGKPVVVTRLVPKYWKRVGHAELFSADQISGRKVSAFAGIASPGSFFDTVAGLGADLVSKTPLPDHCQYRKSHLDKVAGRFALTKSEWMVTTAKDAVKLPGIMHLLPVYYLETSVEVVSGANHIDSALLRLFDNNL